MDSPLQQLSHPGFEKRSLKVYIKRDDLIHPLISGNKWRKLKYNLIEAKRKGKTTLLTFGGAFSNHIYSAAAAAKTNGFKSIGIFWGEELDASNPTLAFAQSQGIKSLNATVTKGNQGSVNLLKKAGFTFTGEKANAYNIGGEWVDDLYFKRELNTKNAG